MTTISILRSFCDVTGSLSKNQSVEKVRKLLLMQYLMVWKIHPSYTLRVFKGNNKRNQLAKFGIKKNHQNTYQFPQRVLYLKAGKPKGLFNFEIFFFLCKLQMTQNLLGPNQNLIFLWCKILAEKSVTLLVEGEKDDGGMNKIHS